MMFENAQHCLTQSKLAIDGSHFLTVRDGLFTQTVFLKSLHLKNIPGRVTMLKIQC